MMLLKLYLILKIIDFIPIESQFHQSNYAVKQTVDKVEIKVDDHGGYRETMALSL